MRGDDNPAPCSTSSCRSPRCCRTAPAPTSRWCWSGFGVGILGHLTRVRWLVGSGIILIFLGALLLPFAAGILTGEKSPPARRRLDGESRSTAINRA